MNEVVDLAMERVEREQDNAKVSVEQLLMMALSDVRNIKIKKPIQAIILIVSEDGDTISYRSCLTRAEEIGYLEVFKSQACDSWKAEKL